MFGSFSFPSIHELIILLPVVIISLTIHEFSHAWAAHRLGDDTAKSMGRLTLNPIPHIDVIGLLAITFIHFGWAKPVPVDPYNLRGDPKRGFMLVSLAGPVSNLLLAPIAALVFNLYAYLIMAGLLPYNSTILEFLLQLVWINIALAILNLLPIPPLDGSRILAGVLPGNFVQSLETYGAVLILGLAIFGVFSKILAPLVQFITELMLPFLDQFFYFV